MTFNPSCSRCRFARRLGRATMALVVFTVPLFGARETGWLQEEEQPKPPRFGPYDNASISASAAVADSNVYSGWVRLDVDSIPDR